MYAAPGPGLGGEHLIDWAGLRWDLLSPWCLGQMLSLVLLSEHRRPHPFSSLFLHHYLISTDCTVPKTLPFLPECFFLVILLLGRNISHILRIAALGYVWSEIYGNERIGPHLSSSKDNPQMQKGCSCIRFVDIWDQFRLLPKRGFCVFWKDCSPDAYLYGQYNWKNFPLRHWYMVFFSFQCLSFFAYLHGYFNGRISENIYDPANLLPSQQS